jgi:subtilase family serine protease
MTGPLAKSCKAGGQFSMRLLSRLSAVRYMATLGIAAVSFGGWTVPTATTAVGAVPHPLISDAQFISSALAPPSESDCYSIRKRRCFAPAAIENAYNVNPLYAAGNKGQGVTIALVDSFGSSTIRADLNNFNVQFGLPHLCGEANYACKPGDPTFTVLCSPACRNDVASPLNSASPGQENPAVWSLEVSLDVEWAHSIAPLANLLLVATPTAETLGVQGFPQMIDAEQRVVDNGLAQVISQSFGAAEESFSSTASLLNLRHAYIAAQAHKVSVFASSGDGGNANIVKVPVHTGGTLIPFPTVGWPASDPLVTAVGGTYLCVNATTGVGVDGANPPSDCAGTTQREIGWVASGGGFSHVFAQPSYQGTLPPGSNVAANIGHTRGVPDVALEASSHTGVLVYDTMPGADGAVVSNVGGSKNAGWFIIGGTSASSPMWAGLAAIADQMNGGSLGFLNPALYKIGADPALYANDFFDVTTGNNDHFMTPQDPNYAATTGWDPVTGLGTPNAANLLPDLIAEVHKL